MSKQFSPESAILALQNFNFEDIRKQGQKGGMEENVKNFVVRPVLELLGFTNPKDVDYEYHIKSRRVDIALFVNDTPKVFVECKSPEQKLLDHVEQALDYAYGKQVSYVLLTNGWEFRLYKSFIENVTNPKDRELLRVELRRLSEQFDNLKKWISKDSLTEKTIDLIAEQTEIRIRERVTAPTLIRHLRDSKILLAENAMPKIEKKFEEHDGFRRAVEVWAEASRLDLEKDDWVEKLAQEVAYSFINRLYFYKIAEDRKVSGIKPKLVKERLKTLEQSLDLADIITVAFAEVTRDIDYKAIFEDQTGLLTLFVRFDDAVLKQVVYPLLEYNFKAIDQDILGQVYQEHISREERKKLGQFYTPEWIVDFIIGRMQLDVKSRVLDPVCGSGRFLTRAYEELKKEYKRQNFADISIHSQILQNNLYGFDINPFAVQLTAMSLALKDLDNRTDAINILETDSLAENLEAWVETQKGSVNGKESSTRSSFPETYTHVVGNPPYFVYNGSEIKKRYGDRYSSVITGKTNIASLFLYRALNLLEDDGYLGFVFPKSVLYVEPWKGIRRFILANFKIESIYDLREAFEGVLLEEIVLILRKTQRVRSDSKVDVFYQYWQRGGNYQMSFHTVPHSEFTEDLFPIYLSETNKSIQNKMTKASVPLGSIARLTRGLGLERSQGLIKEGRSSLSERPILAGNDLQRYEIRGQKYLNVESPKLDTTAKGKVKDLAREKLMFQGIIGRARNYIKLSGSLDPDGSYLDLDTVVNVLVEDADFNPLYMLGVLNSRLASYYLNNMIFSHSERTMHFEYAKHIPIKKATADVQRAIAKLASRYLKAQREVVTSAKETKEMNQLLPAYMDAKERELSLRRELDIIDREIDSAVFDLYGLNKTEVATVLAESFEYLPELES